MNQCWGCDFIELVHGFWKIFSQLSLDNLGGFTLTKWVASLATSLKSWNLLLITKIYSKNFEFHPQTPQVQPQSLNISELYLHILIISHFHLHLYDTTPQTPTIQSLSQTYKHYQYFHSHKLILVCIKPFLPYTWQTNFYMVLRKNIVYSVIIE